MKGVSTPFVLFQEHFISLTKYTSHSRKKKKFLKVFTLTLKNRFIHIHSQTHKHHREQGMLTVTSSSHLQLSRTCLVSYQFLLTSDNKLDFEQVVYTSQESPAVTQQSSSSDSCFSLHESSAMLQTFVFFFLLVLTHTVLYVNYINICLTNLYTGMCRLIKLFILFSFPRCFNKSPSYCNYYSNLFNTCDNFVKIFPKKEHMLI